MKNEVTMQQIELAAKAYADTRGALAAVVAALQDEIDQVKKKYLRSIRDKVAKAAERHAELRELIDEGSALFEKPRTRVLHGVKVGYGKGKGKVTFADGDKVCSLIRKHLEDQVDLLIITSEKPNKEALAMLDGAVLKKLGVEVTGTGDAIVIKDAAGEVDKLVEALLEGATEEAAA